MGDCMAAHGDFEKQLMSYFNNCNVLDWNNRTYNEILAFKPCTPGRGGECRTDIYVSLRYMGEELDSIKISVKKLNYEFLVNKLRAEDAESILGSEWSSIVSTATESIQTLFEAENTIQPTPVRNPTNIRFQLGWKLEIANRERALSHILELTPTDVINKVYRGTTQLQCRRHAKIGNSIIQNSGVADYLLVGDVDEFPNAQSAINALTNLSTDFTPPVVYMIFTGHSYNLKDDKVDGNRSLAVAIEWSADSGNLVQNFIYQTPLEQTGESNMMPLIRNALNAIGIDSDSSIGQIDISRLL